MIGENVGSVEVVRHAPRKCARLGSAATSPPSPACGIEQALMPAMKAQGATGKARGGGGSRKQAEIRIGPAGWLYKDWDGIVYPSEKPTGFDQLRYIAEFFNTVEINSSFYGLPR
jgi:hypothetical protein